MHTSFRSLTGAARPLALAALSIAFVGALVAPASADASAFQLKENSAKGLGRAYAGSATAGGDASVVVNNPAAMSELKGTYLQADVTAINFSAKFDGSAHDVLGRPISGGNGGDAGTTLPVPALFFATQVSDRMHVGAGFSVPFGFQTEYDKNWVGRYNGIKSKFQSLDATLSASFDVTDNFSLGASFIAQKTSAELTSAVNYNAVGLGIQQGIGAKTAAGVAQIQAAAAAGQLSSAQAAAMIQAAVQQGQAAAAGVAAVTPPGSDGYARIKGDDWAYGWQLGGYWKLTPNDKLALNYRSKISHTLEGTGNFTTTPGYDLLLANPSLASSIPPFSHTTGSADFTTPAVASASYWHQAEKFGFGVDVAWTKWDVFKNLTVNYGNSQPRTSEAYNWRNTIYASIGGDYYLNDRLTLRGGIAVDSSPTHLSTRSPRVPDSTRKMVTVGIGYKASEHLEINASYAHIFVNNAHVNVTDSTRDTLTGNFDDYGNLLSVSAMYKF
ncbi:MULTISPECIES: OmpP1/FadL family transporter [Rhodanobacter]|uniref:OmpP1/FadL family transporter n=1 Tax=Rhodanobacter TaxID=75309 RepID=UPI0004886B5E|nr:MULTISPECIES: outer membrane protein transport protein [Rhodanobacter]TAN15497.1 MAG: transporter [Rhodanobacter sp.]UJJ55063.1 outer membrane protein transport protein [Rhodanobacter thiooxydans]